jgi:hypothetical protein
VNGYLGVNPLDPGDPNPGAAAGAFLGGGTGMLLGPGAPSGAIGEGLGAGIGSITGSALYHLFF